MVQRHKLNKVSLFSLLNRIASVVFNWRIRAGMYLRRVRTGMCRSASLYWPNGRVAVDGREDFRIRVKMKQVLIRKILGVPSLSPNLSSCGLARR